MSEAAHVPFTEDKTGDAPERLHQGALSLIDISASTMANIGPAYSFYFGFAGIVIAAGLASPLVVVAAIVAIALLGNTLSQFSRAHPSTGGFITFVGKTFGGTSAVTTALLCGAGYIIAIASVMVISGGFFSMMLQSYFNVSIPWIIFSAIFTAGAMAMMFRGVAVSTRLAGFFFSFELTVLLVVSIAALIKNGGHLSTVPFQPSHLLNHFSGLARGFPLAVCLFIGWENSAALAEETTNPPAQRARRRVHVDRPHGRHLPAAGLLHGLRLRLQRHRAGKRRHPVPQRGPQRGGLAGLQRLPGRADLHPGCAHRRGELPVPADLQRRA
jgi:amino acid transporter